MLFNRKKILNILSSHQNNIDKRAINAMFSSIRLYSNGQSLKISSMDGERFLEHELDVKFEKFDIFIPGFSFYELLRKSSVESFEINEMANGYAVRIGSGEFKFSKYNDKHYPEWVDVYENTMELDSKEFCQALKLVKWAASSDDSRPFLNGVCVDIQEQMTNVCATDGLRMALKRLSSKSVVQITAIVGKKSVNDLIKLLEDAQGAFVLSLGKNAQATMNCDGAKVTWKTLLVAGKFPQYNKIIPVSSAAKLEVNCKNLVDTIERMLIVANTNQPVVILSLGSVCEMLAENPLSSGKDIIEAVYTGAPMQIAFNGRLLLEMLNNISSNLVFEINNPHSPVLIKSDANDGVFILAPVKRD